MSFKRITSPQSSKCHSNIRGHEIKTLQILDCFGSKNNGKINKNNKHQLTYAADQRQLNSLTNKAQFQDRDSIDKKQIISQLLQENIKLKEQNDKKNKLIEMLIDERKEIKRVTSLHNPNERDTQQSKTNFRLQSPNQMEFTFYKSPNRGLPKEFQITPSRKMFF